MPAPVRYLPSPHRGRHRYAVGRRFDVNVLENGAPFLRLSHYWNDIDHIAQNEVVKFEYLLSNASDAGLSPANSSKNG